MSPIFKSNNIEYQLSILREQQERIHHQLAEQDIARWKLYELLIKQPMTSTTSTTNPTDLTAILATIVESDSATTGSFVSYMYNTLAHRLWNVASHAGAYALIALFVVSIPITCLFIYYCCCCCFCCFSKQVCVNKLINMFRCRPLIMSFTASTQVNQPCSRSLPTRDKKWQLPFDAALSLCAFSFWIIIFFSSFRQPFQQ